MKILFQNERFELEFASGDGFWKDLASAKAAEFKWDGDAKTWWTQDPHVVTRLKGSGATATPEVVVPSVAS